MRRTRTRQILQHEGELLASESAAALQEIEEALKRLAIRNAGLPLDDDEHNFVAYVHIGTLLALGRLFASQLADPVSAEALAAHVLVKRLAAAADAAQAAIVLARGTVPRNDKPGDN